MPENAPDSWRVERVYSNGCEVCPRIMAGKEVVAEVHGAPYLGFAETLPRARLLAAAPLLLRACRKALYVFGGEHLADCELSDEEAVRLDAILHLTAAIAEATKEAP